MTSSPANKQFEVLSACNAQFFRSDRPWAAIQISSEDNHPTLSEENRAGLLRLVFEDTEEAGMPDSFTPALAAEILDFVAKVWDEVDVLLVHCEVGLSRSPAVAAALCRIYYHHDGQWLDSDLANRLVYELLVETHARRSATAAPSIDDRPLESGTT